MLDLHTSGKEHHEALLKEREHDRLLARLPKQESRVSALSRQAVNAVINKLEALGTARVPNPQPSPENARRGA